MTLTPEQQSILNGEKGETLAKVMKTLVMYGETFGAEKWCLSPAVTAIWSPALAFR
jgi:predicted aconitase